MGRRRGARLSIYPRRYGLGPTAVTVNGYEFPAVLPAVPGLPTARRWNERAADFVGPRRRLFQVIRQGLAAYESSRREYATCCRRYLQRREEMQQHEDRQTQSDQPQRRDSGSNATRAAAAADGLGGYGADLARLLAAVVECHRRVRQAFDGVCAAYDELEWLDSNSGGGDSRALSDLQAGLAAGRPSGPGPDVPSGATRDRSAKGFRSDGSTAPVPQQRFEASGEATVTATDSGRTEIPVDTTARNGHRR